MTLTIELTDAEAARLRALAAAKGTDEETALHQLIADLPSRPTTGAEALAYWQREGCLGTFADGTLDSPDLARRLREEAQRRDWNAA